MSQLFQELKRRNVFRVALAYLAAGWGDRSHWVRNLLVDPRVVLESALGVDHARALRVTDAAALRRLFPETGARESRKN